MTPASRSVQTTFISGTRGLLRLTLLLGTLSEIFVFCFVASAQQPKPAEYQVKAVYLYNFGRFIEWPAAAPTRESAPNDDTFAICVLGHDPFGHALDDTLAGEVIDKRKLIAKRISNSRDAIGCRILFVSSSETGHLSEILPSLENTGILTVSDMSGFTANGGMIQFVLKDNKVRFEVNLTATKQAGLTLSSQLLKVATNIIGEPSGGGVK